MAMTAWSAKVDNKFDLLIGEWPDRGSHGKKHADRSSFAQERNAKANRTLPIRATSLKVYSESA